MSESEESKSVSEEPEAVKPEPNLKWVGVRSRPAKPKPDQREEDKPEVGPAYAEEPHASVHIGPLDIELPSAAEQQAGFYSEHAADIVASVPGYKLIR